VGGVLPFLWPTLPGRRRQSNGPTFWPKFLLEAKLSYESLEPLIGFLTYLEPKLCHKNQKVVKTSTPTKRKTGLNNTQFGYGRNSLESCSSPPKTREDLLFGLQKKFQYAL